jgi:hypothetical protein
MPSTSRASIEVGLDAVGTLAATAAVAGESVPAGRALAGTAGASTTSAATMAGGLRIRADLRPYENGLSNSNQLLLLFHAKVMRITTKA